MSTRVLYLFRHGETDWNAEGRFQGHIDIPLNENGRAQARELALKLQGAGLEAILSSDLDRARETARIVARDLGLPVFEDPGLREAFLGDAQGLTYGEIEGRFGTEVTRRWRSHAMTDADISYPGGETGTQVIERSFAAMLRFIQANPFKNVGVSTHGGVIRRIMQAIRPPGSEPVPIPNAVLYRLHFDELARKWHLPVPGQGELPQGERQ